MAEIVNYEITIKAAPGVISGGLGESQGSGAVNDTGFLANSYQAFKQIKSFAPVALSAGIAKDIFQWQISLVGRNTGSQATQDKINTSMNIAGQILGVGGALIGGLATGNPMLFMGAIAGAAHIGIGYAKEIEQANYERKWENIGLQFARERAGASFNRSRE